MEAPSVIRLRYFVHVPRRICTSHHPGRPCSCGTATSASTAGSAAENVDHVQPRSKGGKHTWDNVVAACRRCNGRKENRLPARGGAEARSAARRRLRTGSGCSLLVGQAEPEWLAYLGSRAS